MEALNPLKVFLGGIWVSLHRGEDVLKVVQEAFPQLPAAKKAWVSSSQFLQRSELGK